jgi:hypothetical protein
MLQVLRRTATVALNEKLTQGFSRFGGGSVAKAIARNLGADWRSEIAVEKCAKMRLRFGRNPYEIGPKLVGVTDCRPVGEQFKRYFW